MGAFRRRSGIRLSPRAILIGSILAIAAIQWKSLSAGDAINALCEAAGHPPGCVDTNFGASGPGTPPCDDACEARREARREREAAYERERQAAIDRMHPLPVERPKRASESGPQRDLHKSLVARRGRLRSATDGVLQEKDASYPFPLDEIHLRRFRPSPEQAEFLLRDIEGQIEVLEGLEAIYSRTWERLNSQVHAGKLARRDVAALQEDLLLAQYLEMMSKGMSVISARVMQRLKAGSLSGAAARRILERLKRCQISIALIGNNPGSKSHADQLKSAFDALRLAADEARIASLPPGSGLLAPPDGDKVLGNVLWLVAKHASLAAATGRVDSGDLMKDAVAVFLPTHTLIASVPIFLAYGGLLYHMQANKNMIDSIVARNQAASSEVLARLVRVEIALDAKRDLVALLRRSRIRRP